MPIGNKKQNQRNSRIFRFEEKDQQISKEAGHGKVFGSLDLG